MMLNPSSKIRIGIVDYRNARPLLFGLQHSASMERLATLKAGYPAEVARQLAAGEIDIGLVPVALLARMPEAQVVSSYCIGTEGEVASVCLYSQEPLSHINTVLLDYQSQTSVRLCQILMKEYWQQEVSYVQGNMDYINRIQGTTAGVIIGDRALEMKSSFRYCYDLGTGWNQLTGLPFMFAAWVSASPLDSSFSDAFDKAQALGLQHLHEVADAQYFPYYDLHRYYTKNIVFERNAGLELARNLFLKKMDHYNLG